MATKTKPTKKRNARKAAAPKARNAKAKKPTSAKAAAPTKAKAKKPTRKRIFTATPPPPGSKGAKVIDAMREPGGVTAAELVKATGWLPHTLRAFVSQKIRGGMGLRVETEAKREGGTIYRVLERAE